MGAYEAGVDSSVWDDFADYFVDGEEFADADFELSDLQDIFCADGVPADAADVVTNAADFSDAGLPFDQLFLDFFLDNVEGWDEGELTASATSSDYEWLNAICPVMVLGGPPTLTFGANFWKILLHMVMRACLRWLLIVTLILWRELLLQLLPTSIPMSLVHLALLQVRTVWLCRLTQTLLREECVWKDMIVLLLLPPRLSPNQSWTTLTLIVMKLSQMLKMISSAR